MVSNLVSVSVESVQVRSASYTFDNNAEKQCYEAGHIPGCSMPTQVSSPFMPPGYQNCNNGLSYGTPMPITVLPIAPQPYHPRNALNESEPNSCCVPQQVSLLSPQPAPAPANVAEHQTSVLRKQLDILRSTVVSLPEPRSSGNLEPSRTKTAHQTSAQTKCKPIETQDLRMSEVVYEKIHNPSPTQLSEPNFTGSSNGILPCAMSNSSNRIVDKMTSSALASGISSTEINSGSMRRNDRLPPNQLSTPTCSEQLNGAGCIPINNDVCSTSLSKPKEIPNEKKSQDAQSAPSLQLHSSPNIPVVGEINFNLSDKPCQNPQIGEIEVVNVSVDDYDSDIIIDEAPLKPPVELICLSGDEAEIDSQDDLKHEFDLINMGLDPITHSTESTEVAPVEPSTNPNQLDAEKIKQKSKRKKSKKSSENRKKRRRNIRRKASIEQVGTTSSSGNTFDDSSILKECHEMIDSLRIGRFVVVDDDSESHTEKEEEKSTSVIWKTKKVVFSYTQQSKPEEVPRIKTASTNTPIRLYIDVCTGTESFVLSKDCVIQTELGCEKCLEKENLIREMKEQLYSLRKERDDLNAMVCNYNKIPAIPGLDLPSGEAKLPSGLHAESVPIVLPYKELSHWPCEVHKNTVTTNTPMKDVRVSLETANAVNTHVQNEQTEPIISYEYNHL